MTHRSSYACALAFAAGCVPGLALAAEEAPAVLSPSEGTVRQAAHLYYNLGTGERIATQMDGQGQTSGADTGKSVSLWACLNNNPCEAHGFTTTFYYGLDNPGATSLSTAATLVDWGDIHKDTVVDCVRVNWVTAHADTDLDSDGVGDGVTGLAGEWTVWDVDNGSENCIRSPLMSFLLTDLPGNTFGDGVLTRYSADVDLVNDFGVDMSFEICDTDGDSQGASYHHAFIGVGDNNFDGLPDSDLDGDGLADWSWSVRFYQPGTADFDSDGVPDGVPAPTDADTIGLSFAVPDGTAIDNGDGTWTWDIDTSTSDAGTGEEDRFSLYTPPDANGDSFYFGSYYFGGFSCDGIPISSGGSGYTPAAMFEFQLYGPVVDPGWCPADLNGDEIVNFFDVSLFLQQYAAGDDYNDDGVTSFYDISQFLSDFSTGCP